MRGAGDRERRALDSENGRHAIRLQGGAPVRTATIVECHPALVPFTFAGADRERFEGMAGVSAEVTAQARAASRSAKSCCSRTAV